MSPPEGCQCFANDAQFESECEGHGFTPVSCEAKPNCHWGPQEVAACFPPGAKHPFMQHEPCQCFANDAKFESECEGHGFTPVSCGANPNCHWGPQEVAAYHAPPAKYLMRKPKGCQCFA